MKVLKNRLISIAYRVTTPDGRVLEQVLSDQPFIVVQGSGTLLPEVESQIEGLSAGQSVTFQIPADPKRADPDDRRVEVPLAQLPSDVVAKPGVAVGAIADDDCARLWIREVHGDRVVLEPESAIESEPRTVRIWILDVTESVEEV